MTIHHVVVREESSEKSGAPLNIAGIGEKLTAMTQPNIVIIQADQLAAAALSPYGNEVVQAPNIEALADGGVIFDRAYCNSPLCAPSRASMMTGMLPSRTGAFDNASDVPATVPTLAHRMRGLGYHTALVGRMHFIGPDQLHGFEKRPTSDVYPAGVSMIPDWTSDEHQQWFHDTDSVFEAGVSRASVQQDFDEEVVFNSLRNLTDRVREGRPFLMVSSFIHPHDPYEPPAEHWHRYDGVEIDMPRVGFGDVPLDPHSRRLLQMCGFDHRMPGQDAVRNARRAYYSAVSYVDDGIGQILGRIRRLGLADNTIVIVTADHGDMLGERGLWYKMSPFEQSARVPLIINAPGLLAPRRVGDVVSLVDLLPTLVDLAGGDVDELSGDGSSLLPLAAGTGSDAERQVTIEYLAEGLTAPQITLVEERYKYVHCPADPDQLYDLAADPGERVNLAAADGLRDSQAEAALVRLRAEVAADYDLDALRDRVLDSQADRRVARHALAQGQVTDWDNVPLDDSAQRYVRGDFWGSVNAGRLAGEAGAVRPLATAPSRHRRGDDEGQEGEGLAAG